MNQYSEWCIGIKKLLDQLQANEKRIYMIEFSNQLIDLEKRKMIKTMTWKKT